MKKICVIGSINTDLVAKVECFPKPGETIIGKGFGTYFGGKGANQAVAANRLGAEVLLTGKVGEDLYGSRYLEYLRSEGINTEGISVETGESSGIAVIEVDSNGENHIVIIPGANAHVNIEYLKKHHEMLLDCDIFLFQLEIPLDTIVHTMEFLKEHKKLVILDPAPAQELPEKIYKYVDYITPNETEMQTLTNMKINNETDIKEAAEWILEKGVKNIIAKAGANGAYLINKGTFSHIPGFKVNTVDTTAAGDSFNGGFAYALIHDMPDEEAIRFANAVGAMSTTGFGAQSAMPKLEEVNKLLVSVTQV